MAEDYREIRVIGHGAFGRAVLVEKLSGEHAGEKFVIKQINLAVLGEKARLEAQQEVDVRLGRRHRLCYAALCCACVARGSHCLGAC
jgi:hypothetical protein